MQLRQCGTQQRVIRRVRVRPGSTALGRAGQLIRHPSHARHVYAAIPSEQVGPAVLHILVCPTGVGSHLSQMLVGHAAPSTKAIVVAVSGLIPADPDRMCNTSRTRPRS